ncbi:hypothetical protein CEP88_15850 [Roseobacter denitrificans]|nr:hypothetical protein CEP88_15850 [Roseobacter denitrificans]
MTGSRIGTIEARAHGVRRALFFTLSGLKNADCGTIAVTADKVMAWPFLMRRSGSKCIILPRRTVTKPDFSAQDEPFSNDQDVRFSQHSGWLEAGHSFSASHC